MENLEEVLQALDEFQKMRPTEIPRELEDYLCWVAKTGDPVYQWSMIKTLFREKLTRVMTDFYESCPSLELTPCPNVEHFNYDTMKSNLLERLESFANAPFTVQRICELLTTPRKEYNRVDKFMRAIEKNILVVSTREPGSITRRGETVDGMVNGSVEEDTALVTQLQQQQQPSPPLTSPPLTSPPQLPQVVQSSQPTSQDIEMDWEKDCASTVGMHAAVENESSVLLHTIVPSNGTLGRNTVFTAEEVAQEKVEQVTSRCSSSSSSRMDQLATSGFITTTSDFTTVSGLTSSVEQSHELVPVIPIVAQDLPISNNVAIPTDSSLINNSEVADVVINEDPGSRANLSIENEEIVAMATETTTTTTTTITTTTTMMVTMASATMTTTMTEADSMATTTETAAMTTMTTTTTTPSASTALTSTSATTTTVTVVATVIPLTTDTTRKLQAVLQAKCLESGEKCSDRSNEKIPIQSIPSTPMSEDSVVYAAKDGNDTATTAELNVDCVTNDTCFDQNKLTSSSSETDVETNRHISIEDNIGSVIIEEKIPDETIQESTLILDSAEGEDSKNDGDTRTTMFESQAIEKHSMTSFDDCASAARAVIVSSNEVSREMETAEIHCREASATIISKGCFERDQSINQNADGTKVTDKILESVSRVTTTKCIDNDDQKMRNFEINADDVKTTEISNGGASLVESVTSNPIDIAEESKDAIAVIEILDSTTETAGIADDGDSTPNVIHHSSPKDSKLTRVEDDSLMSIQENKAMERSVMKGKQPSVIESVGCKKESDSMIHLMEVDDEESTATFQQDEQMELEPLEELSKS